LTYYDAIVVGAGVMGIAMARQLAINGKRVLVLERGTYWKGQLYEGPSVRAFGNVLTLGHQPGICTQLALRSRKLWSDLLIREGLWHRCNGILLVATEPDEVALIEEYAEGATARDIECVVLSPREACERVPLLRGDRVLRALHSPKDILLNPRTAISALRDVLSAMIGVTVIGRCPVVGVDGDCVLTPSGRFHAKDIYLCTGSDVAEIFPDLGLVEVKLQMLACAPLSPYSPWGPVVAGGLTMSHMRSFAGFAALEPLRERLNRMYAEYLHFGIHVMAAATEDGTILIGDSHEYGREISAIDKERIDILMCAYLSEMMNLPELRPLYRWHARYYRNGETPWLVRRLSETVTAVIALGGTGLTLSMALAERISSGIASAVLELEVGSEKSGAFTKEPHAGQKSVAPQD
jgi:FAD dependent oxidoreductase TIGR03364